MQPDQTWQALRALSLLAMALLLGTRLVPALQPHRRALLGAVLVLYLLGGTAVLGWYLVQRGFS